MEASRREDRKTLVKFGQIWRFCPLFSSIAMSQCIMNSCHKVVRSIRNTTLKYAPICEAIRKKCTELWKNQSWILHHNNSPAHTSRLVSEFLDKNKTVIMCEPPYSPDLTSADFFLFPKLKTPMKGKRFATIEGIKEKSKQNLLAIPKKKRVSEVFRIISEGSYFEADKIVIDK